MEGVETRLTNMFALLGDLLLVWLCHKATINWGDASHARAMMALALWMFNSKWIKLLGHYILLSIYFEFDQTSTDR
jgi:hypothetical protein